MSGSEYVLRVRGHLDDHWSDWFDGCAITRHDDATTTVAIATADQARLYGVLSALRDIGAELIEVIEVGVGTGGGVSPDGPASPVRRPPGRRAGSCR